MRRPIGWTDKTWPGGKRSVRVEFFADQIRWRFRTPSDESWQDGEPTADNWADLEDKIRELMQRGHLFQKELALVQKLRPALKPPASRC
ncbi:MAG: hypothetical protein II943_06910 [Victivallales bacterium]|nr:hypothetical protein [Victivallales bacterium]